MKDYTKDEVQYIRRNAGKMTYDEIAESLVELGISKCNRTGTAIANKANRMGVKPGNWHMKLKEYQQRALKTRNENNNRTFISSGYYYTVQNGKRMQLHRKLWQQRYGIVPAGAKLIPEDGDTLNYDPSNWKLVNVVTGKPYTSNIRRRVTKSTGKYYQQPRELRGVSETFNKDDFKESPNGWYYSKERIDKSKIRSLQRGIEVMRIKKTFQF